MAKTIVEKILSLQAGKDARVGDIVIANVDFSMNHDINGPYVIDFFENLLDGNVKNSSKCAFVLDHFSPCPTIAAANAHIKIKGFARRHNIKVYPPGEGICHQLLMENRHVHPGELVVATDSHACTYGALNALGISIGATEMAIVLASGQCWFKVPETILVVMSGKLPKFVTSKDIALDLIGRLTEKGAIYRCLEFTGDAIESLSIDSRMVISNMAVEMGAKTAIFPGDVMLDRWLTEHEIYDCYFISSDKDAKYSKIINIELSHLTPKVSRSPDIDDVVDVAELAGKKIDQVVIGSCTNGRFEDFEIAGNILRGRKIHSDIRLIIAPASRKIYKNMIEKGLIEIFIDSGAIINSPGCGPCAGLHEGVVGDGEVVISTTNRNVIGRMGSSKAEVYISSPVVAAYSALYGKITEPLSFDKRN